MIENKSEVQRTITPLEAEILSQINEILGLDNDSDKQLNNNAANEFKTEASHPVMGSVIEISFDDTITPICYGSHFIMQDVFGEGNLYILPQAIPYLKSKNKAEVTPLNNGELIIISLNGRNQLHEHTIKFMQDSQNEYSNIIAEPINKESLPPNYYIHQFLRNQTKIESYNISVNDYLFIPIFYGLFLTLVYMSITNFNIFYTIIILIVGLLIWPFKKNKQLAIYAFQGLVFPMLIKYDYENDSDRERESKSKRVSKRERELCYIGIIDQTSKIIKHLSIPRVLLNASADRLVFMNRQPIYIEYLGQKNEIYKIISQRGILSFSNNNKAKIWFPHLFMMCISLIVAIYLHFGLQAKDFLIINTDIIAQQNNVKNVKMLKEEIDKLLQQPNTQLSSLVNNDKYIYKGDIGCRIENGKDSLSSDKKVCGIQYLFEKNKIDPKYYILKKFQSNFGKIRFQMDPKIHAINQLIATEQGYKIKLPYFSSTIINPQIIEQINPLNSSRNGLSHFYFSSGASYIFRHVDELCEYLSPKECGKLKQTFQEHFLFNTLADNNDWEAMKEEILNSSKEIEGIRTNHLNTPEKEFIFFQFTRKNLKESLEYFHSEAIKNVNAQLLDEVISIDASRGHLIDLKGNELTYSFDHHYWGDDIVGSIKTFPAEIKFSIENLKIEEGKAVLTIETYNQQLMWRKIIAINIIYALLVTVFISRFIRLIFALRSPKERELEQLKNIIEDRTYAIEPLGVSTQNIQKNQLSDTSSTKTLKKYDLQGNIVKK